MTASFIELNPPDVQGKVYRIYNAIALFASLFPRAWRLAMMPCCSAICHRAFAAFFCHDGGATARFRLGQPNYFAIS